MMQFLFVSKRFNCSAYRKQKKIISTFLYSQIKLTNASNIDLPINNGLIHFFPSLSLYHHFFSITSNPNKISCYPKKNITHTRTQFPYGDILMSYHLERRWKNLFNSAFYRQTALEPTKMKFAEMTFNEINMFCDEVSTLLTTNFFCEVLSF